MPSSLGPAEILVILLVALIVLGPNKLPGAARQVGKTIAEVRKWSQGFQDELRTVIDSETAPSYRERQVPEQLPTIPMETPPAPAVATPLPPLPPLPMRIPMLPMPTAPPAVAESNGHVPDDGQSTEATTELPGPAAGDPPAA
jgi:Tat protein translocase TatB subunit